MSQKSNAKQEGIIDVLQYAIDRGKERGDLTVIVAAATAQAELVGLFNETAEELADAVECLLEDNIERLSSAERSQLVALLRDKVDHIEQEFCS